MPEDLKFRASFFAMRIVIKIGTSSICDENTFVPKLSNLSLLVETVVDLQKQGHLPILVTSGAVGMGLLQLNLSKRPKHISQVQAVAAVGQGRLMALYDNLFSNFNVSIAQILITRDNLAERHQYLNALNTLEELLSMNVVPIINENDSVTSSEIRFGDNDSLSAIAAGMIQADYLFLLTDVDAGIT
jgi:glutamate 5-kinase